MNPTRTLSRSLAGIAAGTLIAGLAVTATTTSSQASVASAGTHARAEKPFKVTAKVSNDEPEQGTKIKIKGTVKPLREGAKVRIEKKYEGDEDWKLAGTAVINKKGKYKFVDEVGTVRFRQYRVVKADGDGRSKGKSETLDVTVFGWRYLTSLNPVAATGTGETSSLKINGTAFDQSVQGNNYGNAGSIAYNIDRKCKRFEGRVGLSDVSDTTATGAITLKSDTTTFYSNSFGLTQSAPVTRDVTNVFRITVDWTSSNTEGTELDQSGAVIAIGSPRLLCSF
jgi:hypothetical protein